MASTYKRLLLSASFVVCLGTPLLGHACSTIYMEELDKNKDLTRLQKEAVLEKTCIGKPVEVTGAVINISKSGIRLKDSDNFYYHFFLARDHNCGDLLNIYKKQQLSLSGTISKVYVDVISAFDMLVDEGRCI